MTESPRATITLARHGETQWSREGRHTGLTDLPLTAEGREQARRLGARLAGADVSLVLTSPRRRAIETCELAGLDTVAEIDPDLAEWDYGEYEGLTSEEIDRRSPGWSLWTDGCPGGEQPADVGARADRVLDRGRSAGGIVVLFAHGHILRVVGARWIGLDPAGGRLLMLDTASLSRLGWEHGAATVTTWNDTAHLEHR